MSGAQKFELLSDAANALVVRYVERNFPGVLIQGDTLKILFDDLEELQEEINGGDFESAKDLLDILKERLSDILDHYEKTLKERKLELPYIRDR